MIKAKRCGFSIIELMVVIGVIAILAALLFPALRAHFEGARINEMKAQLGVFEGALEQYQRAFGDYPPSGGAGQDDENPGIERMLACLRTEENGGPFIQAHLIRRWVEDTDGDGRQELVDPWRNPWIYFHSSEYPAGAVYYRIKGRQMTVAPIKKSGRFANSTSYQLWACGPNQTDQSGQDDDVGKVGR